jgi:16S rRNA (cytosine967-C5)-methyltransferase
MATSRESPLHLRGAARALALEIAAEARAEWGFATDLMAAAFRRHRNLGSSDRRLVSETVYGLIRGERRLESIVDELLARRRERREALSPEARAELKLLVYELRQGVPAEVLADEFRRLMHTSPDLGAVAAEDAGLGGRSGLDRDAVRLSYPTWLIERLVADGPVEQSPTPLPGGPGRGDRREDRGQVEEALALAEAMNHRAPLAIRANTVKITREALAERLASEGITARPTRWAPAGLVLESRVNVFGLAAFSEGLFEVMDEGSQLVAELVAPPPQGRVVDACAGAGGKTLALAAMMGNRGRLLALDTNGKKLEELRRRARRAGLSTVAARPVEGAALPPEARLAAWDRVLVDAPCSGLGTLRRNPEARWRLQPQTVDRFPAQQLALLVTYASLVAEGGRLIYATCSVLRSENDAVVERFCAERPEFVPMAVKEIWGTERAVPLGGGSVLRLSPERHDTDGFFAAVLRRVR